MHQFMEKQTSPVTGLQAWLGSGFGYCIFPYQRQQIAPNLRFVLTYSNAPRPGAYRGYVPLEISRQFSQRADARLKSYPCAHTPGFRMPVAAAPQFRQPVICSNDLGKSRRRHAGWQESFLRLTQHPLDKGTVTNHPRIVTTPTMEFGTMTLSCPFRDKHCKALAGGCEFRCKLSQYEFSAEPGNRFAAAVGGVTAPSVF